MATIIQTDKGFKIIRISHKEMIEKLGHLGSLGICDSCNGTDVNGYYIPVLNQWYCSDCYAKWHTSATYYPEDAVIEERNFNKYKLIFGL